MFDTLDFSKLQEALCLSKDILYKNYLNYLDVTPIVPPRIDPCLDTIQLLKVVTFTYSTDTTYLSHFSFVLNALHNLNITLCSILNVSSDRITVYLGVRHTQNAHLAIELIKKALLKAYTTIHFEVLDTQVCSEILTKQLFNLDSVYALSSAIVIPETPKILPYTTSLLQPLLSLMAGEYYTILFLANSISRTSYKSMQEQVQTLYNDLFPFKDLSYSATHHVSATCTDSHCHLHTESQNTTSSESDGTSCTHSKTCTDNNALSLNYKSSNLSNLSKNDTHGNTLTTTQATNQTSSCSSSNQASCTYSVTKSKADTTIDIETMHYKKTNSQVSSLLTQADLQLARYTKTLTLPMFNFGAYFLSASPATSIRAASSYIGLVEDSNSVVFPSFINTWEKSNPSFNGILAYLQMLQHPSFCTPLSCYKILPTIPITNIELNTLLSPMPS